MRARDRATDGAALLLVLTLSIVIEVRHRWQGVPHEAPRRDVAVLRLAYDKRCRSRFVARLVDGREVGVQLPRGSVLRDGDVLVAESGEPIVVEADAQPVLCITAASPLQLMRVVYHLANRHVPAQIERDYVLIEPDGILADLARHFGADVEAAHMPFDPEAGAYAAEHGHGHSHVDDYDPVAASVGEALSIEAHRRRLDSPA